MEAGEAKPIGFSSDHHDFSRKFREEGLSVLFSFCTNSGGKRHGSAHFALFPEGALEMDPSATVREFKLKRKSTESVIAGVGNIAVVCVRFGNLAEKTQIGCAAQGVVHDSDGLGNVKSNHVGIGVHAGVLRNGNGLGTNRCGEDMRQPFLVGDGGRTKLSVENDAGFFSNLKSFCQLFYSRRRFGGGRGGVGIAAAWPAGGGCISKRDDGFFNDGGNEIEHGKVGVGKVFGILVNVGIVDPGLHGGRPLRGGHHEGLDRLAVEQGFGRVGKGGVVSCDVEGGIELAFLTYARTLKGTGPSTEISGFVETIARDGGRPTVCTGNRGDESPKRDRTQVF